MNTEQDTHTASQRNPFARLRLYYLLALSVIALTIVLGQVVVQYHLREQESDARLINVAGRQRMLGQQLAKVALELQLRADSAERTEVLERLKTAQTEWVMAQHALLHGNDSLMIPPGNDAEVKELLNSGAPHFEAMVGAASKLINQLDTHPTVPYSGLRARISVILKHERPYLDVMERTVQRLEVIAAGKVARLKRTEYMLLVVALLVILLEILLIFIPTTRRIRETLARLIKSERDAQQMSREIGALYSSLEASYERISAISIPVSSPQLVAKADRGGNVTEVVPLLATMLGKTGRLEPAGTIAEIVGLQGDAAEQLMDDLVETVSDGQNWNRELVVSDTEGMNRYLDIHVVPIYATGGEVAHLDILMTDLTRKRQAEQGIYRKDKAEIERKINEQKYRSILVLEGQEDERKRIAMNIHDGIGQLLTSLKFQLAAINIYRPQEAEQKLEEINQLVKEVIQEVRRVTFNLNPPVLSDYGLAAGLKTLVQEIDRMSHAEVRFVNESGFNQRMSSKVENNVFRIVQEALNNAVKYAESPRIELFLKHDDNQLRITVKDYGKGFERKATDAVSPEVGHGFLNMYERAAYINGTLEVQSQKGAGTIVKLFVPLTQTQNE